NPVDDQLLADAIQRSGRVILPVRGQSGPVGNKQQSPTPLPMFGRDAGLGSIGIDYNYQNAIWHLPYSSDVNGARVPSFAALMAGRPGGDGRFTIDYSIDPTSVRTIGAERVIDGRFDPRLVKGKQVIIGTNSDVIGDQYFLPGIGTMGGVFVQILGAETLKEGKPLELG